MIQASLIAFVRSRGKVSSRRAEEKGHWQCNRPIGYLESMLSRRPSPHAIRPLHPHAESATGSSGFQARSLEPTHHVWSPPLGCYPPAAQPCSHSGTNIDYGNGADLPARGVSASTSATRSE